LVLALDCQRHGKEGNVFNLYQAALGRSDEPITAVRLTTQNGSEELDESQAADGRPTVMPSSVASDPHLEIAAIDQRSLAGNGSQCWRRIAGICVFGQVCAWRRV